MMGFSKRVLARADGVIGRSQRLRLGTNAVLRRAHGRMNAREPTEQRARLRAIGSTRILGGGVDE